eukprot:TRINITY_DN5712_c0_g1_i1.p1 TRINITY_DN5712_c0_g1~~TRINITY_DN5712_c0_g1_i1.p1  ORF type:complete len:798 (-),score=147.62 TRINITY_DN5712_c0_g1_i1:412-2805(-)
MTRHKMFLIVCCFVLYCCAFPCDVTVDGGDNWSLRRDERLFLEADFDYLSCDGFVQRYRAGNDTSVVYEWSSDDFIVRPVYDRVFVLYGDLFYWGRTFNFTLRAYGVDAGLDTRFVYGEFSFSVQLIRSDIRAFIEGGDRNLPFGYPLLLDGSSSSNVDQTPVEYKWECWLFLDGVYTAYKIPISNDRKLSIRDLPEGDYIFTLTLIPVHSDYSESLYSVFIQVESNSFPVSYLRTIPPAVSPLDPDYSVFILVEHPDNFYEEFLDILWTITDEGTGETKNISRKDNFILEGEPGHNYTVRYEGYFNSISYAEMRVSILDRPFISCEINPGEYKNVYNYFVQCFGEDIQTYSVYLQNPSKKKKILLERTKASKFNLALYPFGEERKQSYFLIQGQRSGVLSEVLEIPFFLEPNRKFNATLFMENVLLEVSLGRFSEALSYVSVVSFSLSEFEEGEILFNFILDVIEDAILSNEIDVSEKAATCLFYLFENNELISLDNLESGTDLAVDVIKNLKKISPYLENSNASSIIDLCIDILSIFFRQLTELLVKHRSINYTGQGVLEKLLGLLREISFLMISSDMPVRYTVNPNITVMSMKIEKDIYLKERKVIELPEGYFDGTIVVEEYLYNIFDSSRVASEIIGFSLYDDNQIPVAVTNPEPVEIFFLKNDDSVEYSNTLCQSWDFQQSKWITNQCSIRYLNLTVACSCYVSGGYFALQEIEVVKKTSDLGWILIFLAVLSSCLLFLVAVSIFVCSFVMYRLKKEMLLRDIDILLEDLEHTTDHSIDLTDTEGSQVALDE